MTAYIVPERGSDTVDLVRYLFGPGRANEHTNQRVIAAAETLGVEDGTRLDHRADREEILALGRQLDSHRKAYGVQMPGGHVWHCAISLPPGEMLTDTQWAAVARTAVEQLGFDAAGGHAPCRWIAVHHGRSTGGSEHIHLAVNLVREDGTIASTWRERRTMSRVCGQAEQRFGLHVVEGRAGRGMPGYTRAEAERTRRGRRPEPDRFTLARTVRACAAMAADETEFIHQLRTARVLVRPRYATGGQAVTGYSVALRPTGGQAAPVWFGGGRLAADLTLPRLRGHWEAAATGPARDAARADALRAWRRDDGGGRLDDAAYGVAAWQQAADRIDAIRGQLAAVPASDTATWATTARHAAGVYAALSARLETRPGPLAAAADALARSAQTRPGQARYAHHSGLGDMRGVALAARQAFIPPHRPDPAVTLMRALIRLTNAIAAARETQAAARQAAALRDLSAGQLTALTQVRSASWAAVPDFPTPPAPGRPGPTPPSRPPRPPTRPPDKGIGR